LPALQRRIPGSPLRRVRPAVDVLVRGVVRGDEAGSCATLDAHVADGHPLFHGQGPDGVAAILEHVAGPAADPDPGKQREDDVLGADARHEAAVDPDLVRLRVALQEGLGREDHLDLARPDPECERAECPVRARVRVAADDRHARLGQAHLRADDVDDALRRRADAVERDAELAAVRLELADLGRCLQVEHREVARGGGDGMIGGRDGLRRSAHGQAALPQAGEGLGRGDLVDEMEVHGEDRGGARILADDMVGPDLVDDGAWCGVERLARGHGAAGLHGSDEGCSLPADGRWVRYDTCMTPARHR
jgi:hypothetical protein